MFGNRDRERIVSELARARVRIAELESELKLVGSKDPLCAELATLRSFRLQLELDLDRARRSGHPLALAVLDLDRFRALNLEHGLSIGDQVLRAAGCSIAEAAGSAALACRIGADEFAIVMPETAAAAALETVTRILEALEQLEVAGLRGHPASAGIAVFESDQQVEELLAAAASALEQARAAGGGRATIFVSHGEGDDRRGLAAGHGDVIAALASTLGERDRYTGDHSESVVDLVERVAEALALDPERVGRARTAALLHDIGKVGVPDEILHKPGPLDEREWEIMRQHPVIGERIIRAIPGMGAIAQAVRHEHERWDGGGYPDGLAGTEIPVEARIILACDAYHAMISNRPYRRAIGHQEAIAELSAGAGTQFDPQVVEALVGYLYGRRQAGLATA